MHTAIFKWIFKKIILRKLRQTSIFNGTFFMLNYYFRLLYEIWNFLYFFFICQESQKMKTYKHSSSTKWKKNQWKISHLRIKAAYCANVHTLWKSKKENKKVVNAKLCGFFFVIFVLRRKSFILILLNPKNKHQQLIFKKFFLYSGTIFLLGIVQMGNSVT